jgi:hypothetical protein
VDAPFLSAVLSADLQLTPEVAHAFNGEAVQCSERERRERERKKTLQICKGFAAEIWRNWAEVTPCTLAALKRDKELRCLKFAQRCECARTLNWLRSEI